MATLTSKVPTMFADHHVLRVREALSALEGVQGVIASSAWQAVVVDFDEDKLAPEAIEKALAEAGYEPGKETPVLAENLEGFRDPAWMEAGARTTRTNQADLTMSGEFRKY